MNQNQGIETTVNVTATEHFLTQLRNKGFSMHDVISALRSPEIVTDVMSRGEFSGQKRYCGSGLAVVTNRVSANHVILITVYADKIKTALRPDQMNDQVALKSRRIKN